MLPNLGGEGSKSQKGAGFIGRIFGRQGSSKDEGGDSPRNTTNRAGTGSLNAPTAAKQYVEPRQAGAAVTTGMAKPAAQSKQDMFSAKSRKVLFQGREETEVSSEGRASVLDHHNVFKRSHTVNDIGTSLSSSPKPAASPKSPVSTATALANLGGKTDSGNSSMTSLVNSRVSIAAAMNVPTEELEGKSHDELKKMFLALQRQTKELKHEVEEKKKSLSGSGGTARTSVIVDFSEPKHSRGPALLRRTLSSSGMLLAVPQPEAAECHMHLTRWVAWTRKIVVSWRMKQTQSPSPSQQPWMHTWQPRNKRRQGASRRRKNGRLHRQQQQRSRGRQQRP
eukprot:GHUV01017722.1.p1 GENE.GHUV01017722.1~~GHUV01017722.1.p1  ORF type:complete len:337 (+),score=95.95 GHUV01017722.1:395-1405(+)